MTTYIPPAYQSGSYDFFTPAPGQDTSSTASRALRDFRNEATVEPVVWESGPNKGKRVDGVVRIRYRISNFAGGLNRVWGTARAPSAYYPYSDLDRFARSSLLTDEAGVLSLVPLTGFSSGMANFSLRPLASANVFDTMAVGNGGTANKALYKETSATDPTLVQITYTPGSVITNLQTGIAGGAAQPERLFVYKEGGAAHILSDLTTGGPTVYATAHAKTNPGWGHIRSPINASNPGAETLLIYANGSIYTYDSTTDPTLIGSFTATLTAVPNGGYPLGNRGIKLPGQPLSAYWFFPINANLTHSVCNVIDNSGISVGKIVRTNMEGTDAQDVRLPISRLLGAAPHGDSIVFWDARSIWQLTDAPRNLGIFKQRYIDGAFNNNSDVEFQVLNAYSANGELYVLVDENTISGAHHYAIEHLVASTGAWHRVSVVTASGGAGQSVNQYFHGFLSTAFAPGAAPFSATTSALQFTTDSGNSNIYNLLVPPPGVVPFYELQASTGRGSGSWLAQFATSGTILSAAMLPEGYGGFPCVLEEVRYLGDLSSSNTNGPPAVPSDASWQFDLAVETQNGQFQMSSQSSAKFTASDPFRSMVKRGGRAGGMGFDNNKGWATRLLYQITLGQATVGGAPTYTTPNGLPFEFSILVFTDNNPRSPLETRGPSAY